MRDSKRLFAAVAAGILGTMLFVVAPVATYAGDQHAKKQTLEQRVAFLEGEIVHAREAVHLLDARTLDLNDRLIALEETPDPNHIARGR